MHVLLDAIANDPHKPSSAVVWLQDPANVGSAVAFVAVAGWIAWDRFTTLRGKWLEKRLKETPPSTPTAQAPARTIAPATDGEMHTKYLVAVYQRDEATQKLRDVTADRDGLRDALNRERAFVDELLRAAKEDRETIAQLRLLNDVLPIDDDWSDCDKTPTRGLGQRKNGGR